MADELSGARLLAVDVGNTITRLGLFDDCTLCATWDVTTPLRMTANEAQLVIKGFISSLYQTASGKALAGLGAGDAILSCVVPALSEPWTQALQNYCQRRALVVGPGLKTGVKMRYRDPAEIGSDRIADLVAALAEYGAPLVVVDLGTTTNFEVINEKREFVGGIIAPGLALGARSLAREAAKLPVIDLIAPAQVIGTCTREAMQAGVVMGEIVRIDGLISMIHAELGIEAPVVLTGTNAQNMAALITHDVLVNENLTLQGLGQLHAMNRRK